MRQAGDQYIWQLLQIAVSFLVHSIAITRSFTMLAKSVIFISKLAISLLDFNGNVMLAREKCCSSRTFLVCLHVSFAFQKVEPEILA